MADLENTSQAEDTSKAAFLPQEESLTGTIPNLEAAAQPAETEEIEFRVNPDENFSASLTEYSALTPEAIQYVLEQQGNFTQMLPEEAAALLIASRGVASELTQTLEQRVLMDADAAQFYFKESVKRMDTSELQAEILNLDSTLQANSETSPEQLKLILGSINERASELSPLIHANPDLQAAINRLQENWQQREQKIADLVVATNELTEENAQEIIPENAEIGQVTRMGEELVVTTIDPQTKQETQVHVKEENIWSFLLAVGVTSALTGSNPLEMLAGIWLKNNIANPVLAKLGIDPKELFDSIGSKDSQAFDGMLKIMDSEKCSKYFQDAIEKRYLYDILRQADPDHIQKIFASDGTKPFGSSGFFSYDHLNLDQELVNRMYNSLSEQERNRLKIPPVKSSVSAT